MQSREKDARNQHKAIADAINAFTHSKPKKLEDYLALIKMGQGLLLRADHWNESYAKEPWAFSLKLNVSAVTKLLDQYRNITGTVEPESPQSLVENQVDSELLTARAEAPPLQSPEKITANQGFAALHHTMEQMLHTSHALPASLTKEKLHQAVSFLTSKEAQPLKKLLTAVFAMLEKYQKGAYFLANIKDKTNAIAEQCIKKSVDLEKSYAELCDSLTTIKKDIAMPAHPDHQHTAAVYKGYAAYKKQKTSQNAELKDLSQHIDHLLTLHSAPKRKAPKDHF